MTTPGFTQNARKSNITEIRRKSLASTKLPDPLSRRHLLEGGLETSKALELAKLYLEAEREVEAVDFLAAALADENAEARTQLESLQAMAVERGDVFLMRSASRALDQEPARDVWQSLADTATRLGRERDAETALRLATVGG
jgi:hypothetical protein